MATPAKKTRAGTFDDPPVYEPFLDLKDLKLENAWLLWFANFYQSLISYLSEGGIALPQLTTVQRDALRLPVGGQMIYNLTTNRPNIFIITSTAPYEGEWREIMLV